MNVICLPRAGGKTTAAIEWLLEGKKTSGYPGWDRVLVTHDARSYSSLRKNFWPIIDDIDHRLYIFEEWALARNVSDDTAVMVDNIEFLLPRMPGTLAGFTVTDDRN